MSRIYREVMDWLQARAAARKRRRLVGQLVMCRSSARPHMWQGDQCDDADLVGPGMAR